jgi:hypothetical protein
MRIDKRGSRIWEKDGRRHRLDGPAVEWFDGGESWYINDHLHRLDGPAIDWGREQSWFVNGVNYNNFKDFQKYGGLSDEQMCILRLKYGEIK